MNFKLINPNISDDERVVVYLNDISFFASINGDGLERSETAHPQKEVDYERSRKYWRPVILGVDGL